MKIIIMHDADARIEVINVADHLIGNDIESFLISHGYSVNNITWFAAPIDYVPVVFHNYDTDRDTGEERHVSRNARLKDFTIHEQAEELNRREQAELIAALRKYGEKVEGGFEVHFKAECPIIAGYLYDEPCDIAILAARVDENGHLYILGEDRQCGAESLEVDPTEIFPGHIDYITSTVQHQYMEL